MLFQKKTFLASFILTISSLSAFSFDLKLPLINTEVKTGAITNGNVYNITNNNYYQYVKERDEVPLTSKSQ